MGCTSQVPPDIVPVPPAPPGLGAVLSPRLWLPLCPSYPRYLQEATTALLPMVLSLPAHAVKEEGRRGLLPVSQIGVCTTQDRGGKEI